MCGIIIDFRGRGYLLVFSGGVQEAASLAPLTARGRVEVSANRSPWRTHSRRFVTAWTEARLGDEQTSTRRVSILATILASLGRG